MLCPSSIGTPSYGTNEDIAESLEIAMGTPKSHVHNILRKLDVDSRGLAGIYWRVYSEENGRGGQGRQNGKRQNGRSLTPRL
ncbi:MAG TPA: LuxR C-terminal-related transcriptional regulator [Gemmatimonadota bacterium]|nr:LuxR C-terminal-related transcriptional regulator [Gemmatimonadota bacterium]